MDAPPPRRPDAGPDSPAAMLDHLSTHPEWSDRERDLYLGRLVERFPPEVVAAEVRRRLDDLTGQGGEALLRLIEAQADPALLSELAAAVERQPDLPAERAWEALAVLENAGMLARSPVLQEWWDELSELLDEADPIDDLIDQIEDDPDGLWLALQGLGAVEAEVRPEIVAGLADHTPGPGLIEFARLLAYCDDLPTRAAALSILGRVDPANPDAVAAWRDLAAHHPDAGVSTQAQRRLGRGGVGLPARRDAAEVVLPSGLRRSLVSAVDGQGQGTVLLSRTGTAGTATVAFLCDLEHGVRDVLGDLAPDADRADATFDDLAGRLGSEVLENAHELAIGLLAGGLTLRSPDAPVALRYWVEAVTGPGFQARPFPASFPGWDPLELPFDSMSERARDVLDGCPDWLDHSPLTFEIAREIRLRDGLSPPDPKRDAGAFRYLFEHGLKGQLEKYRRMLLWMAWFWKSSGQEDRGRSALALAWQLSDAQHVVPGHPFTVELMARSLAAAQQTLDHGR